MRCIRTRSKLPRILLAERDCELRSFLKHVLGRAAYTVSDCSTRNELQELLSTFGVPTIAEKFDLLLFDMRLLDQALVGMIRGLQQRPHHPPLVLFDGWQFERGVPDQGLKIAAVIESPANVSKCVAVIREFAPHRPPDCRIDDKSFWMDGI